MSMALSPETEAGLVDGNLVEVECSADRNGKANGNADGGRNGVPQNTAGTGSTTLTATSCST